MNSSSRPDLFLGGNLNEVAAGVVKNCGGYRSHVDRRLSEANADRLEPLIFGVHIVDPERSERNAVLHERLCKGPPRPDDSQARAAAPCRWENPEKQPSATDARLAEPRLLYEAELLGRKNPMPCL